MSYRTGIREQLAAALVNASENYVSPGLAISGTPGEWAVWARNVYDDDTPLWLASSRRPSEVRNFKTLDAAFAAAVEVARLADPTKDPAYVAVEVCMSLGGVTP